MRGEGSTISDMAGRHGPGAERRVETDLTIDTKCALRNFIGAFLGPQ